MTLNSADEKDLFKKTYGKENINFVELTDYGKDSSSPTDWFDKACASGVQCDSLIVSGHFAGTFFGEHTKLELPLKVMSEKSCAKSCEGVLKSPKEVFLFGCNTLADKGADTRSPEVYRRVLTADGITQPFADRIVAARYSAVGESFKESMSKVFAGVPKIYGYSTVGPRGSAVAPQLEKVLKATPNYTEHLARLEAEKLGGKISAINKMNQAWGSQMGRFPAASCNGKNVADRSECGLFTGGSDLEKLSVAKSLLNDSNRKAHFISLQEFFAHIDVNGLDNDSKDFLKEIRNNDAAKKSLMEELPKLKATPVLRFQMMDMAHKIGWISDGDIQKEVASITKAWAKAPPEEVTSYVRSLEDDASKAPAIQNLLMELFKSDTFEVRASAMTALSTVRYPSSDTLASLRQLLQSPDSTTQKRTAYLVRNMKIKDPEMVRQAQKIVAAEGAGW